MTMKTSRALLVGGSLALLALLGGAWAWRSRTPRPPELPGNGHEFVRVEAGDYLVGKEGYRRNPRRTVRLEAFEIAATEATNAQFARFVEATGHVTEAERLGYGYTFEEGLPDWTWRKEPGAYWRYPFGPDSYDALDKPDLPVTQVSAFDARAYCEWAGLRLPTLEEWEVAARAGVQARYPWGDELIPESGPACNIWHGETHEKDAPGDPFLYLAPAGSFAPNAWGLSDVIGNVFEYCAGDPGELYPAEEQPLTYARGGSWWCSAGTCDAYNLTDIGAMVAWGSLANQGFRPARTPAATSP